MDKAVRRVLLQFRDMNSDKLDLHALFEAGGNDPAARDNVIGHVATLVRKGYLESLGSDFYELTERGKQEIGFK